eukprot:CAMPEP_0118905854 /NCGR_PEP_ID=MMETSP1166-20130328/9658_1 /TAXON_ID=1104430 /ORGANISM="Chrysoreinhardia sp, Strain CCMP3193" /LENGTH=348 /DNA_ID=CAMNT_0006845125 /DNA_START=11 /DNA_END=1057 /DNA_ORIENTATION=-
MDLAMLDDEESPSARSEKAIPSAVAKLKGQKGATTWRTTEAPVASSSSASAPCAPLNVTVDATARTAYGEVVAKMKPYEGPLPKKKDSSSSSVSKETTKAYAKPALVAACERTFVEEVNVLRADPKGYASLLCEKFRPFYDGTTFHSPTSAEKSRETSEGVFAFDDMVHSLKSQPPLPSLLRVDELAEAAATSDKSPSDFGAVEGECFDLKSSSGDAAEAVLELLVSDGDRTRRARRRLLDSKVTRIGSAVIEKNSTTVACFVQTFRPRPKAGSTFSYQGPIPIKDAAFLALLLALPEPLPADLTDKIRAGAHVTLNLNHQHQATVTVTHNDIITEVTKNINVTLPVV